MTSGTAMSDEDRSYRPGWLAFAPFLGTPPELTRRQWTIIGSIAIATMFEQYGLSLFSLALKQIQLGLSIPENRLGELGAIVSLGALPAFLFSLLADRLGRRRILLFTIVASFLFTGATGFSWDITTFVLLQFFARIFAVAEVLVAYVVIAEELDSEVRGWGIGALTALGACGNGLSLLLFTFVDTVPLGWRAFYLIGFIPLAMMPWFRRNISETERFDRFKSHQAPTTVFSDYFMPILDLIRKYPGRFIAIGSVILLHHLAVSPGGFFGPKYLQDAHGWAPWQYAILGFFGGFIGIFGSSYAGRLSDKRGRRRVAILFLTLNPFFVIGFYQGFGWLLPPLWIAMIFAGIAGGVVLETFGNELFPTSYRSTASGARMVLGTLGAVTGLWAESFLYGIVNSHWTTVSLLVSIAFLAPVIVALFFPETSGRSLEEISPDL